MVVVMVVVVVVVARGQVSNARSDDIQCWLRSHRALVGSLDRMVPQTQSPLRWHPHASCQRRVLSERVVHRGTRKVVRVGHGLAHVRSKLSEI
jgi:hypothetical protein